MPMSQESLNIILGVGFIAIVICVITSTYYFVKALKSATGLTENIREKVQMNILRLIPAILVGLIGRFFKKRG